MTMVPLMFQVVHGKSMIVNSHAILALTDFQQKTITVASHNYGQKCLQDETLSN